MNTLVNTPTGRRGGGKNPTETTASQSANKRKNHRLVEEQRQAMLENFDMEVEDKLRSMRMQLEADKRDLHLKAEVEIAQLPKYVREMPLKSFLTLYHGDTQCAAMGVLAHNIVDSSDFLSRLEPPNSIRSRFSKPK